MTNPVEEPHDGTQQEATEIVVDAPGVAISGDGGEIEGSSGCEEPVLFRSLHGGMVSAFVEGAIQDIDMEIHFDGDLVPRGAPLRADTPDMVPFQQSDGADAV